MSRNISDKAPNPRIYHLEGGVWVDVTLDFDSSTQTVRGVVSSLSFFAAGQPDHTAEWLSPVKAFMEQENQLFTLNKNQALPLNLVVKDGNGNVVLPDGLVVELIKVVDPTDLSKDELVVPIYPQLAEEGDHLKEKINFKLSAVTAGEYLLRVRVGNTTLAPDVHFTIS